MITRAVRGNWPWLMNPRRLWYIYWPVKCLLRVATVNLLWVSVYTHLLLHPVDTPDGDKNGTVWRGKQPQNYLVPRTTNVYCFLWCYRQLCLTVYFCVTPPLLALNASFATAPMVLLCTCINTYATYIWWYIYICLYYLCIYITWWYLGLVDIFSLL